MDLDRIDRNLNKMQTQGASKEEMQLYLNSETQQKLTTQPPTTQAFIQGKPQDDPSSWQRQVSQYARPAFEMGGMVGAGILAAPTTVPTFGTGPVAAGAAGYAMGSSLADRLDELLGIVDKADLKTASLKAVTDIKKGAEYEMGGRLIAPVAGLTAKTVKMTAKKMGLTSFFSKIKEMFPSLSDRGILLKAKETLKTIRQETPVTAKTGKETEAILKRTGIKEVPTYAQRTGGIKAGYQEQSLASKNAELADILKIKDATIMKQAGKHIAKIFPSKAGVSDVISAVGDKQAKLATTAERLKSQAGDVLAGIKIKTMERPMIGERVYLATKKAKVAAKGEIKGLYAKIPEQTLVENEPIHKALRETLSDFKIKGGGTKSLPRSIIKQIRETTSQAYNFRKIKRFALTDK